jgi:regulatory protein
MKITSIKHQLKRKDRYSIYIDDLYSFSISEAELVRSGLRKGADVTTQDIESLTNLAERDKAYDRAVRYIAIRARSKWEMEQYLGKKGYDKQLIAYLVQKLVNNLLLHDEKFAQQWIQWRLNSGGRSKARLRAELRQKHICDEIIDNVLSTIDEQTEIEQLKNIIERKSKISQYRSRDKLMAYLARQGYSYYHIKQALGEHQDG